MAHTRFTLSVPPAVGHDLDRLCQLLGASRSTVVTLVLEDVLETLLPAAEYNSEFLPGRDPTGRRLVGASEAELRGHYGELRKLALQMEPDSFELSPPEDRGAGHGAV